MKKLVSFICLAFAVLMLNAQKAKIETKKVTVNFEQPEFLKNIKTFSYTIQDDGKYWNYTATEEFPTLASVTEGLNIEGLTQVKDNADLQIIVGFSGNQLKTEQSVIELQGTYHIILLDKNNRLITTIDDTVKKKVVVNPKKYGMKNRDARNITKAKIVTDYVEKLIKQQEHVFTGSANLEIPFGLFKKTKGGNAEAFNVESQPLVDAIIANPDDKDAFVKAIAFWTSQLEVDFGKKVKDKTKNKVIYANLTSAYLLNKEVKNAKKNHEILKKSTGLFDGWMNKYKPVYNRFEAISAFSAPEFITVDVTPNFAYVINLGAGTYKHKKKDPKVCTKIEVQAFVANVESGVVSLDNAVKPKIYIYENDKLTYTYSGDDKKVITTEKGEEIVFKAHKGAYKPFLKLASGKYRLYNGYTIVE